MVEGASEREIHALRQQVADLQRRLAQFSAGTPTADGHGAVTISEREELMVEAERVAHMGSWIWNIETDEVHWSDELYRIFGYDPATAAASTDAFFRAVHPEDRERVRAASARGVSSGIPEQVDYRVLRPDGSVRHVTMSGAFLYDTSGTVRRIVGTILDVTSGREAEAAMARAHSELEEAQAIAGVGSWTLAVATGEVSWSTQLRRILGAPPDEVPSGEGFLARLHVDDRARLTSLHQRVLATGQPADVEVRVVGPSAVLRVKVKGVPHENASGEVTFVRGTVQDVTEQRLLEEQLVQAQKMEAIGRLAGGLAHDLNNHLMVIEGNIAVLRLPRSPELDALRGGIRAASQTTSRLLAFGRSSPLRRRVVDPNHLVQQSLLLLERVIPEDISLCSTLGEALPRVDVDEGMIGQCLVNLVLNARDAVSSGGTIEVLTRRAVDAPDVVELAVKDDGSGMEEAVLSRVFEPFFTTKAHGKGSGLGLAMVQGTVAQHGGTVTVTSDASKGSTFVMRLPVAEVDLGKPPTLGAPGGAAVRRCTILVVEDQYAVATVLRRMLEADGHRVLVALRPSLALDTVRELGDTIDLVICDVVMPEMRGAALVRAIRAATGRDYPVLFMSGYSHDEVEPEEIVRLSKPFVGEELRLAVAEALGA